MQLLQQQVLLTVELLLWLTFQRRCDYHSVVVVVVMV